LENLYNNKLEILSEIQKTKRTKLLFSFRFTNTNVNTCISALQNYTGIYVTALTKYIVPIGYKEIFLSAN